MGEIPPIWTLEARESVLFDVISSYFDLSDAQMRREIVGMHAELLQILRGKGLNYYSFRSALVPQLEKLERALLFDTSRIESGWYGYDVASRLVPALDRDHRCSIRVGDLILKNQDLAFELLAREAILHRYCETRNTSQLYAVYVNNLTESRANRLHERLIPYEPYVGYIPTTFASRTKDWLSLTLVGAYLKIGAKWLCGHEDDVSNEEDYNVHSWPLDVNGYSCSSLQSIYFDHFLNYKIERAVYPGFENDTRFALTAISDKPKSLTGFNVLVEEAKAKYLRKEKAGSLARAGFERFSTTQLQELIASKVARNYIYALQFKYEKSFFNITLELENPAHATPTRLLASLEYQPDENLLRLVTFY
jgi:hypothetical protein